MLWSSVWFGDDENEFLWFLHPFFRPGNPIGSLLCEYRVTDEALPKISPIQHPNGHVIEPVVDYYFHWQAYALIDVIRAADCFKTPILNVPDATERARRLVGLTKGTQRDLSSILSSPSRWGGLAEPMTWISHYRQFRVASGDFEIRYVEQRGRLKRGAVVSQAPIGHAMLCCLAARNYFAHQVYRDQELLNKKSSKFLLGGILLAVLTLLNN